MFLEFFAGLVCEFDPGVLFWGDCTCCLRSGFFTLGFISARVSSGLPPGLAFFVVIFGRVNAKCPTNG